MTGLRHRLPLRLVLCLFLLANPLLGIAAGAHTGAAQDDAPAAATTPCHAGASMDAALAEPSMLACPHCAGDGPAAACQCCDFGSSSVPPLVPATPARQETGPATVMGRLPDSFPRSPGERLYRPPIHAV